MKVQPVNYCILCDPLHEGELHSVTYFLLGTKTEKVDDGVVVFNTCIFSERKTVKYVLGLLNARDEVYWPWISPIIARIDDDRKIISIVVDPEFAEKAKKSDWLKSILPNGVEIEVVE